MVSGDHGARVDLSVVYGVAEVASVHIDLGDLIPACTLCPRTSSYYMNCCLQVMVVTKLTTSTLTFLPSHLLTS